MYKLLVGITISAGLSTTLLYGLRPADIIQSATITVAAANTAQLRTALELYYADHDAYPLVYQGTALVNALSPYLQSQPFDATVFQYAPAQDGQSYSLSSTL